MHECHAPRRQGVIRVLGVLVPLALCGCDPFHGVVREIKTETAFSHECVKLGIEKTAGVTPTGHVLAADEPTYKRHSYSYTYEDLRVHLSVLENASGGSIAQFYGQNQKTPPQRDIDRIRPVMRLVEANVSQSCSAPDSVWKSDETCHRVKCEALPALGAEPNQQSPR
jgi:hypothetical protein